MGHMTALEASKEPLLSGSNPQNECAKDPRRLARLRMQVKVACVIMFAEGYYATHHFPFASWMTEELRGTDENLGTYAGLLNSVVSIGMFLSSYVWAKASNRFGRKICLLVGLFSSAISTLLLLLSTDYWTVVCIRFVAGMMNNNLGIVRTALREAHQLAGEDDTSAFSTLSVAFGASSIAGPSLGGLIYGRCPEGLLATFCKPWTAAFLLCWLFYALAFAMTAINMEETADFSKTRGLTLSPGSRAASKEGLMNKVPFLLLLVMGGGHSYVFTGWELSYPLLARVKRSDGGQGWVSDQIGVTFMVGSIGLVIYSMAIYPKLVKRVSALRAWIWSWCLPVILLPLFPRILTASCRAGASDLTIAVMNYSMQLVMSVFLGGGFIGIQLLLNSYVGEQRSGAVLLQVANMNLVSTQALVRTVSPLSTGKLFELGLAADHSQAFGEASLVTRALTFDHLSVVGIICCILCALLFSRIREVH
mmetsp:Transcript_97785/g.169347  ORF Transcript_97785/g.169347 Transcript_97785/m.169347 type:complete len:478 (+) Transcript_97785:48-1481(+)